MTNAPRAALLAGTHPRRVIDLILERASATGRTQPDRPDPSRKLGLVIAGPLADTVGLATTFLALSLPMVLLGLGALWMPSLRDLDRDPQPAG